MLDPDHNGFITYKELARAVFPGLDADSLDEQMERIEELFNAYSKDGCLQGEGWGGHGAGTQAGRWEWRTGATWLLLHGGPRSGPKIGGLLLDRSEVHA